MEIRLKNGFLKTMQTVTSNKNNKIFGIILVIFVLAICWHLFWTSGIDFFWEDFDVFHLYWTESIQFKHFKLQYCPDAINPTKFYVVLGIINGYAKEFFKPKRLFQIGFDSWNRADRPYQFLIWDLWKLFLNNKVILYRIVKAIFFAINICIIFLIINRISKILAIAAILLYMSSSEIWLSATYISSLGLLAQCGTILSILLFIKLTEKQILNYKNLFMYYFLIIVSSNFAVLTIGDGRYLAIIFFLTILFFRRRQLLPHMVPLSILFMMEFPILGYVKRMFFSEPFSPINFTTRAHTAKTTLSSLISASSNYKFLQHALGDKLIILLLSLIVINIFLIGKRFLFIIGKLAKESKEIKTFNHILKERLFLFTLWFFAALFMIIRARGLRYGNPFNFQLFDLSYFIAPFIIFICFYMALINGRLNKKFTLIFMVLCFCLVIFQVKYNLKRFKEFRDIWGNHFCAWQNTKKYIENKSDNALTLALNTDTHYRPFIFENINNRLLFTSSSCDESEFCELKFIESKFKESFIDVFVAAKSELSFRGKSENVILNKIENIYGNCNVLYSRLFYRPSKAAIYLYHFKLQDD